VELRACDKILCEPCYLKNETLLKAIRLNDDENSGDAASTSNSTATASDVQSHSVDLIQTTAIPIQRDISCEFIITYRLHYSTDVLNKLLSIVDITDGYVWSVVLLANVNSLLNKMNCQS